MYVYVSFQNAAGYDSFRQIVGVGVRLLIAIV